MNQLDGKQIKDTSIALNKLTGGQTNLNEGRMQFGNSFELLLNSDSIVSNNSVVNKEYVDSVAQGLDIKKSARIRVEDESVTLSGEQTLQSIPLVDGDRVFVDAFDLISGRADENNIYVVRSGAWEIAEDTVVGDTLNSGAFTFIDEGDFANTGYVLTTTDSDLSGTDPALIWTKFTGSSLNDTGVTADTYGDETTNQIPTFTVDSKGRLTNASSYTFVPTIGDAEDGSYNDGIFNDFTENTPIGTAVDRFNEMLLLLAPAPPKSWDETLKRLGFTENAKSARAIGTGSNVDNLYTNNTPEITDNTNVSFLNEELVSTGENARIAEGTFELIDNGTSLESFTLSGDATTPKTSGYLRHSGSVDPYDGVAGKAGFWKGITSFEVGGSAGLGGGITLPSITASTDERTLELIFPGNNSPTTFDYYIDDPLTVSISNLTADLPVMGNFISGLPSLDAGDSISNISFDIENVSSYFYSSGDVWQIQNGLVSGFTGDPDSTPTSNGETGTATNKNTSIRTNQFSDTGFSFSVRGRNSVGTYGSSETFSDSTYRVDSVSDESNRLTSGSGSYPSSGYGANYDSTQSLLTGTYTNELLLNGGEYQYPTGDYTAFGADNYNTATGTRFATFNVGNFNNNSTFTLDFQGTSGFGSSFGASDLLIEVIIDGQTSWVDGQSPYAGVGNPGSGSNGVASVTDSTDTSRTITFGTAIYTGDIIVRVGLTQGSTRKFESLTIRNIV
jgi:hypothetical protein